MQPLSIPPRHHLTGARITALIRDSATLLVDPGLEVIDTNLNVVDDISADLRQGGEVSRDAYATLHGTCRLTVARQLDWGNALVRPYLTLSDGVVSARFNLGAYHVSVPHWDVEQSPQEFDIHGVDVLAALDTPVGDSYAVTAGTSYLEAVETILAAHGYTQNVIDRQSAATVLPAARVWPLDDTTTWLTVVNDLLGAIGYQGIWSDWDGRFRCQPYENPTARAPEWLYTVDDTTSMIGTKRTFNRDFFDAPNRWVAVRTGAIDDTPPVEGAGVWTYVNHADGDTSVEARGRIITRVMYLEAANQAALVAAARRSIAADMDQRTRIEIETSPNPAHWHFDRLTVTDPQAGPPMAVIGTKWTLPLDGTDMRHEWSVL